MSTYSLIIYSLLVVYCIYLHRKLYFIKRIKSTQNEYSPNLSKSENLYKILLEKERTDRLIEKVEYLKLLQHYSETSSEKMWNELKKSDEILNKVQNGSVLSDIEKKLCLSLQRKEDENFELITSEVAKDYLNKYRNPDTKTFLDYSDFEKVLSKLPLIVKDAVISFLRTKNTRIDISAHLPVIVPKSLYLYKVYNSETAQYIGKDVNLEAVNTFKKNLEDWGYINGKNIGGTSKF